MPRSDRFQTVGAVKTYQENLTDFIGYTNTQNRIKASQILNEEISRLEAVKRSLLAQEEKLFQRVGSYKAIKEALNSWNASGVNILINGEQNFIDLVKKIADEIQLANLESRISEAINKNDSLKELFFLETLEEGLPQLYKVLNEGIENNPHLRLTSTGMSLLKGNNDINNRANLGLTRYLIAEELKSNNGKTIYKISFKENPPKYYKSRIIQTLNKISGEEVEKRQTQISKDLQNKIIDDIESEIPVSNGTIRNLIINEMKKHFYNFGFNQNTAAIKGALGEIYWTCFWRYISNDKLSVSPIGKSLITSRGMKGQQVPIDIVLEGLGFQVKNYNIDLQTNEVLFKNKEITLNGYIRNRLQMDPQPFSDFYFSWGYNKVLNNSHARMVYGELFNRFERIMAQVEQGLKNLSLQRLDKVLRLDTEFSARIGKRLFSEDGLKFNVAYLIGGNIIFSSDIIDAIIKQLEGGEAEVGFKDFSVNAKEPNIDGIHYAKPSNDNPVSYMKDTLISYEIYIKVDKLINAAINRLN